jgi:hypothetical protein
MPPGYWLLQPDKAVRCAVVEIDRCINSVLPEIVGDTRVYEDYPGLTHKGLVKPLSYTILLRRVGLGFTMSGALRMQVLLHKAVHILPSIVRLEESNAIRSVQVHSMVLIL